MLHVKNIMSKEVFILDASASVLEAAWALTRRNLGGAPVRDAEGNLVGMLSKTDLVDPAPSDWIKGSALVEDIMNPDVVSVYEDDPAAAAAKAMADGKVHRLVVYNADGKISGIVTAMDVVKALARGDSFSVAG
jgi:predicted transcriptional regulator